MPRFGLTLSTLVLLAGCGEEANIAGKELPQMPGTITTSQAPVSIRSTAMFKI